MNAKRTILFGGLAIVFLAVLLPVAQKRSNCGGNSYALCACSYLIDAAEIGAKENESHFEIGKIGKQEMGIISMIAQDAWGVHRTDILVRTNFILGNTTNREIIVVCSRAFGNVPQPTIWNFYHKNPAHAVGYSDRTTGLISTTDFSNLNLSGFVSAASLLTNSEPSQLKN